MISSPIQSHPIADADLFKWINVAEKHLRSIKGKEDIEVIFRELSTQEPWRTLPEELELTYWVREAVCFYFFLIDLLNDRTGQRQEVEAVKKQGGATTPSIQAKARFISTFATFVMANSITLRCEKSLRHKDKSGLAKLETANFELVAGKGVGNDLSFLLSYYVDALRKPIEGGTLVQNPGDLYSVTADFWKAVSERAALASKEFSPELMAFVEKTTFHRATFAVRGFSAEDRKEAKVVTWTPVEPQEVIGDQDVTIILRRMCERLVLYDPLLQRNPVAESGGLIESTLLDGPPGTGKTTRQRMMMTLIDRFAELIGLERNFYSFTADQVKNEFYGKTAQLIAEFLRKVQDPLSISLFFVDDIDLLVKGDRNDPGTSGADLDIMKALMDFFSGTGTRYIGNYLAVAATNKPTATDGALRQRFVYPAIIGGPETWEDYADLAAIELRKFAKTGLLEVGDNGYVPLKRPLPKRLADAIGPQLREKYVSRKDGSYSDIGHLCAELHKKDPHFTGRPVKNAVQVAIAQAADFDIPEKWFTDPNEFRAKSWDDRLIPLKGLYQPLNTGMICMALEQQFETEQRYRQEEFERRIKEYAEEITIRSQAAEVLDAKR